MMNIFKRCFVLVAGMVLGVMPAMAKERAPTEFNTYDGVAPGGRSLAMGLAYCAVGGDPASMYFNPAGLASIGGNQTVCFSFEAARQSALTAAELLRFNTLANRNLSFIALTSGAGAFSWRPLADVVRETVNGTDRHTSEVKINAFTLSATHQAEKFATGLNISYLNGRAATSGETAGVSETNLADGNGVTLDFGIIVPLAEQFRLGLNCENLAGFMWWDDYDTEQLPFGVRAGFAFEISEFLTFASDMRRKFYRGIDAVQTTHFGIEQSLGLLKLRGGIYGEDLQDQDRSHMSLGVGYEQNGFTLSIAGEKYRLDQTDVYRYLFSLTLPIRARS